MECAGALILWKRSEEARHLRYTKVISDGDSKTIAVLNENEPYGSGVEITKHEYVGHVQKRLGKRVRAVRKKLASTNKEPKQRIKVLTAALKDARRLLREANAEVREGEEGCGGGRQGEGQGKRQGEGFSLGGGWGTKY